MAKSIQLVLFCLIFVAYSVAAKCPTGKKVSFEQAACFQSDNGKLEKVALSTLFTNVGEIEAADLEVKKFECSDISRKRCKEVTSNVDFYEGTQEIEISLTGCESMMGDYEKCSVFYDVHIKCDTKHPPKASILIPTSEKAIFYEGKGCNFFPEQESESACPDISISLEYSEDEDDDVDDDDANVWQALVKVDVEEEEQKKLQHAYMRYYVDNSGSCDYESNYLQLPITEVYVNLRERVVGCSGGTNLYAELVYMCKEHTFTSNRVSYALDDIHYD